MTTSVRQRRRPAAVPPPRAVPRITLPRWTAVVAVLGALLAITVGLLTDHRTARATAPPPPTAVAARVDGQGVPVREFVLYMAQERAATFTYFQNRYGAGDGPHFWTTPHDGTTPADYLRTRALADVTRATVLQRLAHRYGLLSDPTYAGFLRDWAGENDRRRAALAAHKVIYGPVQYTEANYLTYMLNDLSFRLEQKLTSTGLLKAAEGQIRHYYDTHRSALLQGAHAGSPVTTPPFSQIRSQVRKMYLDDSYQALVKRAVESASAESNPSVVKAISVD